MPLPVVPIRRWSRSTLFWGALAVLVLAGFIAAEAKSLFLRVRSAPVREKPSISEGSDSGRVYAGAACEVLERSKDGDWVKVRAAQGDEKVEGWVHATVLAERAPNLEAGEARPWVKDGESGLPKHELTLAEAHAASRKLDLKALLKLEQNYPKTKDLDDFLRQGKLGLWRPDWPSLPEEAPRK
jgi:hypothetical protein